MYHSNMLSPDELVLIPRSTRKNWNRFSHEAYYGHEMVADYIEDFDCIKEVLTNKHIRFGVKCMTTLSYGYKEVLSHIEGNKKLLRKHADKVSFGIQRLARITNMNLSDACQMFGVSRDWFYRHRNKKECDKSFNGKCFHSHPNQLTFDEVQKIEKLVSNSEHKGKTKTSLYYHAMRNGILGCALSTFFKYANLLGHQSYKKPKEEKRSAGFRAKEVFEWLHVDVTHIQTQEDGIQYVAFVKDNYSRALLHVHSTSERPDSGFIRDLFIETFEKYGLLQQTKPIHIVSDGGSENKGSLLEWIHQIDAPPEVKKLTAQTPAFPFSNSMSESVHRIYKSEFMQGRHSVNIEKHHEDLERFMDYYNYERYFGEHFGLTVMEVLQGEKPNKFRFRDVIEHARKERLEKNQAFKGCPFSC